MNITINIKGEPYLLTDENHLGCKECLFYKGECPRDSLGTLECLIGIEYGMQLNHVFFKEGEGSSIIEII